MNKTDVSAATKCDADKSFFAVHSQKQLFIKATQMVSDYGRGTGEFEKKIFEQHPELKLWSQSNKSLSSDDMMQTIKTYNLFLFRAMIVHRPDLIRQKHLSAAIEYNNFPAAVELIDQGVKVEDKHRHMTNDPKMRLALVTTDPVLKDEIDVFAAHGRGLGDHMRLKFLLSINEKNLSYRDFIRVNLLMVAHRALLVRAALGRTSLCIFYQDIQFMLQMMEQHRHVSAQIPAISFPPAEPLLWRGLITNSSFINCDFNSSHKSPLGYRAVNTATPLIIQPMLPTYFCDANILGPELVMVTAAGRDYSSSDLAMLLFLPPLCVVVLLLSIVAMIRIVNNFEAAGVRPQAQAQAQGPGRQGFFRAAMEAVAVKLAMQQMEQKILFPAAA